jgi:hypothetical protein
MMTDTQRAVIASMKRSVDILRCVARECQDLEAADDIAREAQILAAQIARLEAEAARELPAAEVLTA